MSTTEDKCAVSDLDNSGQQQQQQTQPKQRRKDKLETLAHVDILFEENRPQEVKRKKLIKRPVVNKITSNTTQKEKKIEEVSQLQELMNKNCEKFLNLPKTDSTLKSIADQQMRINYLLAVHGMPAINFNLWSDPETLHFQLRERLKQRSKRQNLSATDTEKNQK